MATVSNSTTLSNLLTAHLPAVRLDRPVLDYLTFILNELLSSIYSAASLSTHISELLLTQELVDSRQEADTICQRLWTGMMQAGLVKPRERKVGASTAVTAAKSAAEERKEAEDENETGESLPYDPFVTVKHAAASSRKPQKKATPHTASTTSSASATTTAASSVLSRPSDHAVLPSTSGSTAPSDASTAAELDIGYQCEALYPADGLYYPAIITALPASPTEQLQVMYLHFGNFEWLDSSHIRNVRSPSSDDAADAEVDDEEANIGEVRLLTKSIRIGDAEEAEREKREKKRQERKKEEERRELERGGMNIKLSRKKLMERERKREEDEKRRQWDETKRREEMAAALPIHLKALAAARRDKGGKMDKDVSITEMTLLAPDNAVLLANTDFKLVAGRRYGLVGRNGIGKCFARATRLRLFSGDTIAVESIVGGEQLMGDDGLPRTITCGSLIHYDPQQRAEGEEQEKLYRITPSWDGARPFTVNGPHILVLVNNTRPTVSERTDRSNVWQLSQWEVSTDNRMCESISMYSTKALATAVEAAAMADWAPLEWEVSVEEFLSHTPRVQRHCKLVASEAITFNNTQLPSLRSVLALALNGVAPTNAQVEYMAWWLGVWMTDGISDCAAISQGGAPSPDPHHHEEIMYRLRQEYERLFYDNVDQVPDHVSGAGWQVWWLGYGVGSVPDRVLRAYGLINNKHIPHALICDTLSVRRRLLAGLIDGDGYYHGQHINCYEIAGKDRDVLVGYKELAATLGLRNSAIHVHDDIYINQQTGEPEIDPVTKTPYRSYRIRISGNVWDTVQYCAATYKQCPQPGTPSYVQKNEDTRCYEFSIHVDHDDPTGEYFGFAVHGGINRRFLLEDYTVTHNTTLLRQLSAYKVPGFPAYLRVQHVEQEIVGDDVTVIESVLNADVERRMLIDEEKRLTNEKKEKGEDVKETTMASAGAGEDRLSDIYSRLNEIDAWTAESRAATICAGLGFTTQMLSMKTKELSGGWRMRVSLASALLVNPDILLLDEPTNHLDFPAVLWLTNYLTQTFNKTLVCVSHDRVFLNEVITDVVHFTNRQSLDYYRGDYQTFVKVKAEKYLADKRTYEAQQMKIQHINDFITTFRTEKKSASQDRKVGQVLSRLKMLEKMERLPNPDDEKVIVFSLDFPDPAPLRQPVVANVKDMSFRYDVNKSGVKREDISDDGGLLLENVTVTVDMSSRIGILGPNGCGKCFARDTRLRLFSGDTIAVQDIRGGEQLMGTDHTPRTVEHGSLIHYDPRKRAEGEEEEQLYRIDPDWDGASSFTVNGPHILVLVNNTKPRVEKRSDTSWEVVQWEVSTDNRMVEQSSTFHTEALAEAEVCRLIAAGWEPVEWEVSVEDYLAAPAEVRRACMLFASKAVNFINPAMNSLSDVLWDVLGRQSPTSDQLEYMAWWLGIWLSAGESDRASISLVEATLPDSHQHHQISARLLDYQLLFNEPVMQAVDKLSTAGWTAHWFEHPVGSVADRVLRRYGLLNNKHVPRALICASMIERHYFLAGLIDGDGMYDSLGDRYELYAKHRAIVVGYKELAATLGLRNSSVQPRQCHSQRTGEVYDGYRVSIAGDMWDAVQYCATTYKRCPQPGTQGDVDKNINSRCYGFSITCVGTGEYFGFAVDGNRRFLLEDYTVTHNTTLIKLLTGDLQPKEGTVWLNPSVSVAVFTQHHVDQLDLGLTPVELLRSLFPGTEIESCRRHLGRFGLGHDWSLIQIGNLSGGQKSRLAFAVMCWRQPHLIILDEPTNHLDMETIDVLIQALSTFKGAVITVSHDQFYLQRTVKQYWAVGKGKVKVFDSLDECKKFSYR